MTEMPPGSDAQTEVQRLRDSTMAAVAILRETAKWTVGGLATLAAAVIAGSPLTGLGSLDWGWRLKLAAVGAAIGFVSLGFVIWRSINVMAPGVLTFGALVAGAALRKGRQCRLERSIVSQFPPGTTSFKKISELRERLETEYETAGPTRQDELDRQLKQLNDLTIPELVQTFSFVEIRDRFLMLRIWIFVAAVIMVAGFGIFAWAANPGKGGEILADPYLYTVAAKTDDLPRLRSRLTDACLQSPLQILVLSERFSGDLEGVTLGPTCPPTRVLVRNKGASIVLQR